MLSTNALVESKVESMLTSFLVDSPKRAKTHFPALGGRGIYRVLGKLFWGYWLSDIHHSRGQFLGKFLDLSDH